MSPSIRLVYIRVFAKNLAGILSAFLFAGHLCAEGAESAGNPHPLPNIIIISVDTLRADRIGSYGYTRPTTPFLDAWARDEAIVFEHAFTTETWTLPSHMSLFTGLYPVHHGVTALDSALSKEIPTLAELLKKAGYTTAGFTGHWWWLYGDRGFGRGMDLYDDADRQMFRHVDLTLQHIEQWLSQKPQTPVFLFVHFYDVHMKAAETGAIAPYDPLDATFDRFSKPLWSEQLFSSPSKKNLRGSQLLTAHNTGADPFTEKEVEYVRARYDDCVALVDSRIQRLFDLLKKSDLYDSALICITADHGENLGEHGYFVDCDNTDPVQLSSPRYFEHKKVFDVEAHIPLLLRLPSNEHAGARVSALVQLTDILPTILACIDQPTPQPTDGINLLPLVRAAAEGRRYVHIRRDAFEAAVRTNRWKLHYQGDRGERYCLYDLMNDPGEQKPLPLSAADIGTVLQAELQSLSTSSYSGRGWQIIYGVDPGDPLLPRTAPLPKIPKTRIVIETSGRLRSATLLTALGTARPLNIEEDTRVMLPTDERYPARVSLVTDPPAAPLTFQIHADDIVRMVSAAHGPQEITGEISLTLDPNQAKPLSEAWVKTYEHAGLMHLQVWYIPAATDARIPTELTPEQKSQLEALGYLEPK